MSKLLIIEDNDEINGLLGEVFRKEGHEVQQAFSGSEGLLYLEREPFDLIFLDLMLPGVKGEEVLAKIREKQQTPVIVITAKTEMEDKLNLLGSGADDYITKPFDVREVVLRAQLQLKKGRTSDNLLKAGELCLDNEGHRFLVKDQEVSLTRQEFQIMYLLMKHPDKIYSKQELFELAWDEIYIGEDKTINVHISNIRKKIKELTEREYIDTVWGIGFKLRAF